MQPERPGREERFTTIYRAHYAAVRAYAWRRDRDAADDVVAETFTIAWQNLESMPVEPLPWLLGIARNVRLNMARGERRRREREASCASADVVSSFTSAVEEHVALDAALRELREEDREILLLAAWECLDRASLAAVLGCSGATAAVRLFRARKRLAAALAACERQDGPLASVCPTSEEGGSR